MSPMPDYPTDDEKKAAVEAIGIAILGTHGQRTAAAALDALLALGWTPPGTYLTGWLAGREAAAAKLDAIAAEMGRMAADPRMLVEEVDIYEAEQLVVEENAKRIRAMPAPGKGEGGPD